MTAATDERVTMGTLRERAPGYAYVEAVQIVGSETLVTLLYSSGSRVEVTMPWAPQAGDDLCPPPLTHVLAVQIRSVDEVVCVALGTSASQQRRVEITLQQAIALAASNVHTVFMTRCAPEPEVLDG